MWSVTFHYDNNKFIWLLTIIIVHSHKSKSYKISYKVDAKEDGDKDKIKNLYKNINFPYYDTCTEFFVWM